MSDIERARAGTINGVIARLSEILADDFHGFRSEIWSAVAAPLDEYARLVSIEAMHAERSRASRAEDIGAFWRSRYHAELAGGFVSRGMDLESANRKADAICAAAIKTFLASTDEADMRKALEGGE